MKPCHAISYVKACTLEILIAHITITTNEPRILHLHQFASDREHELQTCVCVD